MNKKLLIFMLTIFLLVTPSTTSFATTSVIDEVTGDLIVENTYIRTTTNKDNGRFSIKTVEGSPFRENDSNKKLLFMELTPETSFTTFRIDGQDYIFGNDYSDVTGLSSEWIEEPKYYGKTSYCKWRIGDVYIKQYLIVENDFVNEGDVRVKYVVENKGSSKNISCRILLDTMIGENDGSSIMIPGIENPITKETEYRGEDVPSFWYSPESENLEAIGKGTLLTGRYKKVDRFVVGHWQNLSKTKYDYTIDNSLDFTDEHNKYESSDSAICLYFEDVEIHNNMEEVFTTTYGIGDIVGVKEDKYGNETSFLMGFSSSTDKIDVKIIHSSSTHSVSLEEWQSYPQWFQDFYADYTDFWNLPWDKDSPYCTYLTGETAMYDPEYIEFVAYVDNTYEDSIELNNVTFDLSKMLKSYSNIFELHEGETISKTIDKVEKGKIAQATFKLDIKGQRKGRDYTPYVDIEVDGKLINSPNTNLFIPLLSPMQNTSFVDISPKNIYIGSDDKKITLIGEGFKYLESIEEVVVKLVDEKNNETVIPNTLLSLASDDNIFMTLPEDIVIGDYDINIYMGLDEDGNEKLIKNFEKGLVITNNEKYAGRIFPELAIDDFPTDITDIIPEGIVPDEETPDDDTDIEPDYKVNAQFKIKGILIESDGVYKTNSSTTYVINDYIKFEGDMIIDPSKPFKNTINDPEYSESRIRGNGKFYIDVDDSDDSFSNITFYDGEFRIGYFDRNYTVNGEKKKQKNGYFGLEAREVYGANLFDDLGIPTWPVDVQDIYFINTQVETDEGIEYDKYIKISGNWYIDFLKELGVDLKELVGTDAMGSVSDALFKFLKFTNIRDVKLSSSGVDYNGFIRLASPVILGPFTAWGFIADINTYEDLYEFTLLTPMPTKGKKNSVNPISGITSAVPITPDKITKGMNDFLEGGSKGSKNKGGIKAKVKKKTKYSATPDDDQLKFTIGFYNRSLNKIGISADTEIKLSPLPLEISNISGAVENIAKTDINPTLIWLSVDIRDTVSAEIGGMSVFFVDDAKITISDKFMSVTGEVKSLGLDMGQSHTAIVWDHNGVEEYNFNGFISNQEFKLPIYPPVVYWDNKGKMEIVVGSKHFVDTQRITLLKAKGLELFKEETNIEYSEETEEAYNAMRDTFINNNFDRIKELCIEEEKENLYGANPTSSQLREYANGPQFPTSLDESDGEGDSNDITFSGNYEGSLKIPDDIYGVSIPIICGKSIKLVETGFRDNSTFYNNFDIPLTIKGYGINIATEARFNLENLAEGDFPFGLRADAALRVPIFGTLIDISFDEGAK